MCSSDYFAQENLKSLLSERLNDKMYYTFKNNFRIITLDSISETLLEVSAYNQEIAKFVQEVNVKYGISLDYTVLEVSEVPHWAKMFQVLAKMTV